MTRQKLRKCSKTTTENNNGMKAGSRTRLGLGNTVHMAGRIFTTKRERERERNQIKDQF